MSGEPCDAVFPGMGRVNDDGSWAWRVGRLRCALSRDHADTHEATDSDFDVRWS